MISCYFQQEQEIRKIGAFIVEGTVEGINFPICPDLRDGVTIEIEPGTTGGSKMWLGKDYSNPINKDFVEVNKPYEGTVATSSRGACWLSLSFTSRALIVVRSRKSLSVL